MAANDLCTTGTRFCSSITAGSLLQATHIFDGLEAWPTHLVYLASGRLQLAAPTAALPELHQLGLLRLVEGCASPLPRQALPACDAPHVSVGWA